MPWTPGRKKPTVHKGIENVFAVFGYEVVDVAEDSTRMLRRVRCIFEDVAREMSSTDHIIAVFSGLTCLGIYKGFEI